MKKFFRQLFCKHNWEYYKTHTETVKESDFGGGGYNTWQEVYWLYKCSKCGKIKKVFKEYLD